MPHVSANNAFGLRNSVIAVLPQVQRITPSPSLIVRWYPRTRTGHYEINAPFTQHSDGIWPCVMYYSLRAFLSGQFEILADGHWNLCAQASVGARQSVSCLDSFVIELSFVWRRIPTTLGSSSAFWCVGLSVVPKTFLCTVPVQARTSSLSP
jgi:hypothetical protein